MASPRLVPILLLALLVAPAFAGCTGGSPGATGEPAPSTPVPSILAIDGRWGFPAQTGRALLEAAGLDAPAGAMVLGEGTLRGATLPAPVAFAGLDAEAARLLNRTQPAPGEIAVTRALAERAYLAPGDRVDVRAAAWPTPYVATFFEMERTLPCSTRPEAKLCFLPVVQEGEARLRLRADAGARDLAFLPDLVELGPNGTPAWWNGTFEGPNGEVRAFTAHAPRLGGELVPAEFSGPMSEGEWLVRFRLEANGKLAPSGAAGIIRVREPGYLWFDDRYQDVADPIAQADALLASARPTSLNLTVSAIMAEAPFGGADALVAFEDARWLSGLGAHEATALVLEARPEEAADVAAARRGGDAVTSALRLRPLPTPWTPRTGAEGDLVLVAPPDVDVTALPRIEGAGDPARAAATRTPVGERVELADQAVPPDVLFLVHASGADPTWRVPDDGRWPRTADALENLSRSRTLVLASADLQQATVGADRVTIGADETGRTVVAAGRVDGGPEGALWSCAAFVASVGKPSGARVLLPVAEGADRDDVARRAAEAYAPYGLALAR